MNALAGCSSCFPETPEGEAPSALANVTHVSTIVASSHFGVSVHRCSACGQRIAWVSCETVRFSGDGDDCDTLAIPLTEAESDALCAMTGSDERDVERAIVALEPERRHYASWLVRSTPGKRYKFGRVWIPPHD